MDKRQNFVLDGKKRTERTWTAGDAKALPFIVAAHGVGIDDAVFGFSSESEVEKWVAKNGLQREYQQGVALRERTPKHLTPESEAEIRELQDRVTRENSAELMALLRQAKVAIDDPNAVMSFLSDFNPLTGPRIRSALLFQHINLQGSLRYMGKNWTWPDFRWYGFNDTCSSVAVFFGAIWLWEHAWFKGRAIFMFAYPNDRWNIHGYPFYFNDVASSSITL